MSVLSHISDSKVPNLMWPGGMISTDPSIEIPEDEHALCRGDPLHSTLELIIGGIFVAILGCQCWCVCTKIAMDSLVVLNSSFMRCSELDVGGLY